MHRNRRNARRAPGAPEIALAVVAILSIVATLILPAGEAAAQAATITLGRPIEVDLVPPGVITADGSNQTLAFVITDEMGGLAEDVKFRGTTVDAGRLSEWAKVAPGMWTCIYTAPDSSQIRQANLRVKVKVGSKSTEKQFILVLKPSNIARFAFEASPAQIVLNRDPNSSLVFTASGPDGGPLDGLNLLVSVNSGSVQNVQGLGGGKYQALYTPPAGEVAPKVAVVSVVDAEHPETGVGFFTIPLVGNIPWQVNTGMASVNVLMDVAGQRFGPFLSDAAGMATVPILVPPGVSTATATVVMPDGTTTAPQSVDLMVPGFNRIKIAPPAAYMPGDGTSQFPIYVYAVDGNGTPDPAATVHLAASMGEVSEVRPLGGGLYQGVYTTPLSSGNTAVTLTATLPGSALDTETISFELVSPLPSGLQVVSDPADVPAGVGSLVLTGTVSAVAGGSTDLFGVNFFTTGGAVQGVTPQGNGAYTGQYAGSFDGRVVVSAMATLPALPRTPEAIVAWPVDDQVATNQKTVVVAMAVDRYGLPVQGVPLAADVLEGGGSVTGGGTTDATGRVMFEFKAAPLAGLSLVHITGAGMSFTCPLWQTQSLVEGFAFPAAGGATQRTMLDRWAPIRQKLTFGGTGLAAAAAVVTAPVVTPVVTSGGTNPWGAPVTEPVVTPPVTEPVVTPPVTEPVVTPPVTEPVVTPPVVTPPVTAPVTEPVVTPPVAPPVTTTVAPPAGPPARLEVLAMPATLPRDGASMSNVTVRVLDAQNNAVPGEQVVIVATGGVLGNKVDNGDGTFTAILTAPRGGSENQINISASRLQGDLSAFTTVTLSAPVTTTKKPKKPRTTVTAPSPTDGKYRTAKVMFRYPLAGYAYDMEPGICGEDVCDFFPDMDVVGGDAGGLVGIPESFGATAEFFPIEYVGASVQFDRYGYRTDYPVTSQDGQANVFRDGMYHIMVGATGRLPLLKNNTVGPLDVLAHLGYHAQDVVVFKHHGAESNTWTWENLWLHGFRLGVGVRFQIVPWAQVHGGWAGSLISSGLAANEVTVGGTFRVWKGLTLDARYQFLGRQLKVNNGAPVGGPTFQEAHIGETSHGLVLGAGWSF